MAPHPRFFCWQNLSSFVCQPQDRLLFSIIFRIPGRAIGHHYCQRILWQPQVRGPIHLQKLADVSQRTVSFDMGPVTPLLLNIWIYPNLISNNILLPLLVATFLFSTRATRHPTLINLCMTWIFSGIFSLLLFYTGKSGVNSPEPPRLLCIVQASLIYGITPMWSVAVLVFVYHMVATTIEGWTFPGGSTVRLVAVRLSSLLLF